MWLALVIACAEPAPSTPDDALPGPVVGDPWLPRVGTSWQIQFSGPLDLGVDVQMYDVDLFDTPDDALATLRADGRAVVCYFSAGSYEDWRDDAGDFPPEVRGRGLDGWPGEWWLDVRADAVREIMRARLDVAVARGCDGVDPDNVDGFANRTGFPLTAADQLAYNRFLADEAHARGLSVGLKNDLDQLDALRDWFDWQLNEECVDYDECERLAVFTDVDKPAFHLQYTDDWADAQAVADEVCGQGPRLDTLIKTWALGPERLACP